ncbi:B12-binding domain-containing radical SAM protein [Candidatus Omnitrophota bacterium]
MKKILFLNPPLTREERGSALSAAVACAIPYGLISLASAVRNAGYETTLIDATNLEYSIEETVDRVLAEKPEYVGISTVTLSIDKSAEVARLLKQKNRDVKIIVGGAHLSSVPEETMVSFPHFDVGVIGEGEETIVDLLKVLENNIGLGNVKGIIYREGDKVRRTENRPLLKDLDCLSMPAWDLLGDNMADFYRPSAPSYIRLPSTTIVTSRGCPRNCIFCNSKAIFGGLRCFSAGYVIRMLRHLTDKYRIRDISIYDDNFIFFKDRIKKICNAIIDEKIDITWSCYSRVDQGDEELFKLMKKAGCWQISYGIESGSQRILDFMRKNITLEKIVDTLTVTKKAGLRTRGFFMIGNLKESRDSILETINFMKKIPLDDFHFTYFTPLPGTEAFNIAEKYGKFDKTYRKMSMQYPVFIPDGLTAREMETFSKTAYRLFYFRPKIIASYIGVLIKYPNNIKRLLNALRALLSRIFLTNNLRIQEKPKARIKSNLI